METQIQAIEQMVKDLLQDDPEFFLVEVRIKPTNNIKIFIDGDNGVAIEKCISWNRTLYKQLEVTTLFPADDFSLEVSSPGLDEPLKMYRQYRKNAGRQVEVILKDGVKVEGKMLEVNEDAIVVEETKMKMVNGRPVGKKREIVLHTFPLDSIKSTKIQIVF